MRRLAKLKERFHARRGKARYDVTVKANATLVPSLCYFALTFAISWGTVFIAVGPGGFPGSEDDFADLLAPVVAAMLLGPSIAGVAMTALFGGRVGLRDYFSRLKMWRAPWHLYAYVLLIAPVAVVTVLLALSVTSRTYLPGVATAGDPLMHILIGFMTGAAAGLFEELGWTGFAIPMIRKRFSSFTTGLAVGIVWGAWHLLVVWWGSGPTSCGLSMALYLPAMCFSFLPPYRILMVRVFDRTPSLPLAMLMHAALTASVRMFDPLGISGPAIVTYNLVLGAAFWVVVGFVTVMDRTNS